MNNNNESLVKIKREMFYVDLKKKGREESFKATREMWLQKQFYINSKQGSTQDNYDLEALQNVYIQESEIQSQIQQQVEYIESLNKNEGEKLTQAIIKLRILSVKYLLLEKEEERTRSIHMTQLYRYFEQKRFRDLLLNLCNQKFSEDINLVEAVNNILWLFNNLLMGNQTTYQLCTQTDFISRITHLLPSKFETISENCFLILGNILYDNDIDNINKVLSQENLINNIQFVLSQKISQSLKDAASFFINTTCQALCKTWLFNSNHQIIPYLISFISLLSPNLNSINGLNQLLNQYLPDVIPLIHTVQQFQGLFTKLLGQLQSLVIHSSQRVSEESNKQIHSLFNIFHMLSSQSDENLTEKLIQIGIVEFCQTTLNQCRNLKLLEEICFLLSNLACSEKASEQIIKLVLKLLFEFSRSDKNGRVRKNSIIAIFNLYQVCDLEFYDYFFQYGICDLIMNTMKEFTEPVTTIGALECLQLYLEYGQQITNVSQNNYLEQLIGKQGRQILEAVVINTKCLEIQTLGENILLNYFRGSM